MPALNVFPDEIVRTLSYHGQVDVFVGSGSNRTRWQVATSPFEDVLHLFVHSGSPLEKALLASSAVEVQARHQGGDYVIRMKGRAHAGQTLARHAQRNVLQPWAPEGASLSQLRVANFVAHHIEYIRAEAEEKVRYHGPTAAAGKFPGAPTRWIRATFMGLALPFALLAIVVPWLWLAFEGPGYPNRPLALALVVIAGLCELACARLLTLTRAFHRWREGQARMVDAPVLTEAQLAPDQTWMVGIACGVISAFLLMTLALHWGGTLPWLGLVVNGGWLLGPAWYVHLSHGREDREDT